MACIPIVACCYSLRFFVLVCSIVDGGFWLESCNRTSVLLWTVTSLNRHNTTSAHLQCVSSLQKKNIISFIWFRLHIEHNTTLVDVRQIRKSHSLIDISYFIEKKKTLFFFYCAVYFCCSPSFKHFCSWLFYCVFILQPCNLCLNQNPFEVNSKKAINGTKQYAKKKEKRRHTEKISNW